MRTINKLEEMGRVFFSRTKNSLFTEWTVQVRRRALKRFSDPSGEKGSLGMHRRSGKYIDICIHSSIRNSQKNENRASHYVNLSSNICINPVDRIQGYPPINSPDIIANLIPIALYGLDQVKILAPINLTQYNIALL
jgi:hypothetical protein